MEPEFDGKEHGLEEDEHLCHLGEVGLDVKRGKEESEECEGEPVEKDVLGVRKRVGQRTDERLDGTERRCCVGWEEGCALSIGIQSR